MARMSSLEKEVRHLHEKLDIVLQILTKIKKLLSNSVEPICNYNLCNEKSSGDEEDEYNLPSFPLSTVEAIYKLDVDLANKDYRKKVKHKLLRTVDIKNYTGKGVNAAYVLIDKLFTRSVLKNFSWTGASTIVQAGTIVGKAKEPFVSLKNVLDLFYDIVHMTDNAFNHNENINFFKNRVLKYAKARADKYLTLRQATARNVTSRKRRKHKMASFTPDVEKDSVGK